MAKNRAQSNRHPLTQWLHTKERTDQTGVIMILKHAQDLVEINSAPAATAMQAIMEYLIRTECHNVFCEEVRAYADVFFYGASHGQLSNAGESQVPAGRAASASCGYGDGWKDLEKGGVQNGDDGQVGHGDV